MKVPFVNLQAQHEPLQTEINLAIANVFTNTSFVLGEEVNKFEEEFAAYCGVKHAIGLDSGLSALKLALEAYNIGEGDEVIVPANTFIATAAAVSFVGAKPVFVDIKPNTYNIDPAKIEAAITDRTKAIIPVHLYGIPADMNEIMAIANQHNLIVIEDACQAHGAYYRGQRIGSFGHAAAFSFYPAKNLGAAGDGGALVTNDSQLNAQIKAMRNCGQKEKYVHVTTPYNHRLDTVHAAVLRIKLRHLDEWNALRRQKATLYHRFLLHSGVITPAAPNYTIPVWHLYVVRVQNRAALQARLNEQGISTALHYPLPLHLQPYYENLGHQRGDFPITEAYADQILSLPMFPELSEEQIEHVANALKVFVATQELTIT
ncbi:MAG: DegT/DnrJ/EryC1/StrS family aminotransferase [Chloroflexi bacterium]|uniref:DegT/DnrJ/EryC1/StrS family aminotransferase n=1 Tax=Candidatus Flexifilum breve TaxID=3140694 RepID=UPI00313509AD|nr:DegT/DnrJ/EryC1/StrS family aminotransferase [Chloroflexota bacterium]